MPTSPDQPRRQRPLGAFFLLMVVLATVTAMTRPAFLHVENQWREFIGTVVSGAVIGMVMGAVGGLFFRRKTENLLCGLAAGAITGALITPLLWTPEEHVTETLYVAMGGSFLTIVTAIVFRIKT